MRVNTSYGGEEQRKARPWRRAAQGHVSISNVDTVTGSECVEEGPSWRSLLRALDDPLFVQEKGRM